jgi:hypothetical protein
MLAQAPIAKKKRGRPKGSLNKKKPNLRQTKVALASKYPKSNLRSAFLIYTKL